MTGRIAFKFAGWKAIAFLAVVVVAAGWLALRYLLPPTTLPASALEAIRVALRFEYTQLLTAKYGVTPNTLPDSKSAARFAQELAEFEKIKISEMHVRGIWRKRVTQFRVSVAGHALDNRQVRYMRITRVPLSGGWTAIPTGAAAYHLKLL